MGLYNIAPYFAFMAFLCCLFALPVFRFVDATGSALGRVSTIDGLRGFLALSVMLYHGLIEYNYVTVGKWMAGDALFYRPLGGVAVMLFFMITAFLFWTRLLKRDGRPDWAALYIGRLFRIGPLYIVAVVAMAIIVFWRSGFELREPLDNFVPNMGRWLALGLNDDMQPINAFPWTIFILMGVTWSIKYEWWFYFSLVVTATFVRSGMHMVFALVGLAASFAIILTTQSDLWCLPAAFFCGIATASLLHEGFAPRLNVHTMSIIALAALAAMFSFAKTHAGVLQITLTGTAFYLICSGADLFGLLRLRSAQRMGHISYGIYLLQGIPMTVLFWQEPFKAWAIISPTHYWASLLLCGTVLCIIASMTFAMIERPFIRLGKSLSKLRLPWSENGAAIDIHKQ
ncbi:acyltransferase family protein [Paraburkholderia strydomiana]|uniref:acyltransferase family protein n=1 Tax=Paraburkholderia strydomiana TaxID=1245417 RepID=UPI00285982B5|nr:acyltransferase [Paraburkholderia strydomiana]MDR7006099.1 peptidoglycan/LPS O-acetylase OafA/YrhL [Paraburkholderia strydomiana]